MIFKADLVHHGGVNKALFLFSSIKITYEKKIKFFLLIIVLI